jgi:hypothetical protein
MYRKHAVVIVYARKDRSAGAFSAVTLAEHLAGITGLAPKPFRLPMDPQRQTTDGHRHSSMDAVRIPVCMMAPCLLRWDSGFLGISKSAYPPNDPDH